MNLDRDWSPRLMTLGDALFAALFTLFSLESGRMLPAGSTFFDDHHWFAHLCGAIAMAPLAVGIAGSTIGIATASVGSAAPAPTSPPAVSAPRPSPASSSPCSSRSPESTP